MVSKIIQKKGNKVMSDLNRTAKSLNEMSLDERMEYQRMHDRVVILQAAMKGASVELRTLGEKKHPFALENIQNN
jgi:hypothetical protein